MLGFYNYTVILTYIGMLSGFTGITSALSGNIHTAMVLLMVAGVCDMFDGAIASTRERTREEKNFGIQIDSLSDLICFGILPAVITCAIGGTGGFSFFAAGIYVLAALIRLAWFNVDEQERQLNETGSREVYLGLPVTSAALVLPILSELAHLMGFSMMKAAPAALFVMGIMFLCPIRLRKPAIIGKAVMVIVGVIAMAFLLLGFDV